jgi:hypothetical protein
VRDDDGEGVVGDRQLDILDPGLAAGVHLLLYDRSGGIGDVDLVAAEFLEAAAGAGDADGDVDLSFVGNLKLFGDRFGHRIDGARSIDFDNFGLGLGQGCDQEQT